MVTVCGTTQDPVAELGKDPVFVSGTALVPSEPAFSETAVVVAVEPGVCTVIKMVEVLVNRLLAYK